MRSGGQGGPRDLALRSLGASGLRGPSRCSKQGLALSLLPGRLICLEHLLAAWVYGKEAFGGAGQTPTQFSLSNFDQTHLFSDIRTNLCVRHLRLGLLPMDLPELSTCSSPESQGKLGLVGFTIPPGLGPACWADHQEPQTPNSIRESQPAAP